LVQVKFLGILTGKELPHRDEGLINWLFFACKITACS